MKMYLKLNGSQIVGHDYHRHDDYQTEIETDEKLVNRDGEYIKKFEGELLDMEPDEQAIHPLRKQRLIRKFSQLSFEKRTELLPEYKLLNVALGVYDTATKTAYKSTILAFRSEFYRVKGLLEQATTKAEIEQIIESVNFPTEIGV